MFHWASIILRYGVGASALHILNSVDVRAGQFVRSVGQKVWRFRGEWQERGPGWSGHSLVLFAQRT